MVFYLYWKNVIYDYEECKKVDTQVIEFERYKDIARFVLENDLEDRGYVVLEHLEPNALARFHEALNFERPNAKKRKELKASLDELKSLKGKLLSKFVSADSNLSLLFEALKFDKMEERSEALQSLRTQIEETEKAMEQTTNLLEKLWNE